MEKREEHVRFKNSHTKIIQEELNEHETRDTNHPRDVARPEERK